MKEAFGTSFGTKTNVFLLADIEIKKAFCPDVVKDLKAEYGVISMLYFIMILNTAGMFTAMIQKIMTYRNKDNVTLNYG